MPRLRLQGFTLIELLFALTLAALLLTLGVPAFGNLLDRTRLDTEANDLLRGLRFAREQAIQQQRPVTLAPRIEAQWNQGWVIFLDDNHNGQHDEDESILRVHTGNPQADMRANMPLSRYVRYNAQGQSQLLNGGFQAGTFRFCPQDLSQQGVVMVVNRVGRVRVSREVLPEGLCDE